MLRGRASSGEDDDVAIGLDALARGLHTRYILQSLVHHLALAGGHRLEEHTFTPGRTIGAADCDRLERRASPVAIPRCVDSHWLRVAAAAMQRGIRDVLQRIDRLTVLADQEP